MTLQDDYRAYVKAEKRRLKGLPYFAESEEKRRAFVVLFEVLETHSFEDVLRWVPNPCSDPIYRVEAAVACVQDSWVSGELRAGRSFVNEPVPTAELFGFEDDDPEKRVAYWMLSGGRSDR